MQLRRRCTYSEKNFIEERVAFQIAPVYVLSLSRDGRDLHELI
jgi:hypothetical protein